MLAWLVDELVGLGPDVTLFASEDCRPTEKLHSVWPRARRLDLKGADPGAACSLLLGAIAKRAGEFDVIHSRVDWLPLPLLSRLGVRHLTTAHGRLELPGLPDVVREFSKAGFVSISDNQRRQLPDAKWIGSIQPVLPSSLFRPSCEQGYYLAFLGRLTAEKAPEDAIRIDRAVGTPLRIAARIPRAETAYFKTQLQPDIGGERVTLVGEVDDAKKRRFSCRRRRAAVSDRLARAVWSGDDRGDGMQDACYRVSLRLGPGSDRGGCDGFIVDGEEDTVRGVRELPRLDRRAIRSRFEDRFTATRMSREHEARYRNLLAEANAEARVIEKASAN